MKFFIVFSILLSPCSLRAAEPTRPNVLFIFCDDHTTQALSAYGESRKLVQTPGIDRIAKDGMLFNRCLVTNSICGPSRATVLTGKYSHLNGFHNNTGDRFDGGQQTFPKLLQKAGYQTAVIGKWHLGSDPTGFDYWNILPGQGAYYNPDMIANGVKVAHKGYVTDIISELSVEWLRKRDKSRPFLLMSQHKAPHRGWEPALRHLNFDKGRIYQEPATLFDDYKGGRGLAWRDQDMTIDKTLTPKDLKLVPPKRLDERQLEVWNQYYGPRNEVFRKQELKGKALTSWKYQRYMHDYLATIMSVDEAVGRLLDCLEEEGLSANTLVVYSSDQGFFLGEHGWFDKRWILEESIRTPLLVRWPGVTQPGTENGNIVSTLDFAQTILDVAGVSAPPEMQGASLVPLLKGESPPDWRKSFFYQYYEYPQPHRVRPHYGVITDDHKLVHYYMPDLDEWELYDRRANPEETRNFIKDPAKAETVARLKGELARLRKELRVPESPPRSAHGTAPFKQPGRKRQPKNH